MIKTRLQPRMAFFIGILVATAMPGATVYNESAQGDLSNSGLSPTLLPISLGSNVLTGTTGRDATAGFDRDYFTVVVPTGFQITSIIEQPGTVVGGAVSFIGLQAGSQVTVPTNATTAAGLLGWYHYGSTPNTDILPLMAIPDTGSSGFTPPLGPGTYSFWIQDFNLGVFNYGFNLVLAQATTPAAAPEPGSYLLAITGLGVVIASAKRARRQVTSFLHSNDNEKA
jgi:hypothetical protein